MKAKPAVKTAPVPAAADFFGKLRLQISTPVVERRILLLFFFLSGACGLIYQVVWLRVLGLIFGNTTFATSTVVAGFMAGLGLGALYFGRWIDRRDDPVRVYGYLEGGIALYSFLTPLLWKAIEWIYVRYFHSFDPSFLHFSLVKFVLSFAALLVPTFLMGGTLPVLSKHFVSACPADRRQGGDAARPVGLLYAWNTLGAVLGVIFTGFFALYLWGVWQTVYFAGLLNLLIAVVCVKIFSAKSRETNQKADNPVCVPPPQASPAFRLILLMLFAVSGAVSMVYEIAWTRILAVVLGSSIYAFSVMLAAFLTGISAGSFVLSRFLGRLRPGLPFFAGLQMLTALFVFLGLNQFDQMPFYFVRLFEWSHGAIGLIETGKAFLCGLVMFLPTFFIGALFACFIHIYHRTGALGREVGTAYFSNTVGNIAGAFLTGFFIIPAFGIQSTLSGAAAVSAAVGLAAFFLSRDKRRWQDLVFVGAALFLVVVAARNVNPWDKSIIASGAAVKPQLAAGMDKKEFEETFNAREVLYYKEGASSTVSVVRAQDRISLAVNGKVDASSGDDAFTQYFLGHLPMMLFPDAKKVLIIGLGSGSTAAAVAGYPVESVEIVEIEKAVMAASDYFIRQNRSVLNDKRVRVQINDGRNYLLVSDRIYDVIISEPSNPWMAGVSNLFSREYYEIMRGHLSDSGVVCQWIHGYSMSSEDLRMILHTFAQVFPDVSLWVSSYPDILLIGRKRASPVDVSLLDRVFSRPEVKRDFLPFEITSAENLFSNFWLGDKDFRRLAAGGKTHSDNHPYLEFSAPRNLYRDTIAENYQLLRSFHTEAYPPLEGMAPAADQNARFHARIALGYMVKKMYLEAQAEMKKAQAISPDDPEILQNLGLLLYLQGEHEQAVLFLLKAQEMDPKLSFVSYALGLIFQEKNQKERALLEFNRAVELDPMNPKYLKAFGNALYDAGQFDAALQAYRGYIELYGSDFDVLNRMTDAVFSVDNVENQQGMANLIIGVYPNIPSVYEKLGEGFEARGLFAQAAAVYARLIEQLPREAAGYVLTAKLYSKLGKNQEAKEYLQKAADLNEELKKNPQVAAVLRS